MNVIYSLSHLTDWIGFAKEMESRLGWKPAYWLTSQHTDNLVKDNFPECARHRFLEIIRGVSPSGYDLYSPNSIDATVIRQYAFEMDQAIKMMDRLDSGDAFSYNERKRYFIKILNYALNVYDTFKPEIAVFTETPHHATQYILYAVLKKKGVKTVMFKPVFIFDMRLLIYNGVEDDPVATAGDFTFQSEPDLQVIEQITAYVKRLKSDYSVGAPDYMKQAIRTSSHSRAMFKTALKLLNISNWKKLVDPASSTNILKLKGRSLEESSPSRLQLYWIKVKGSIHKRRLRKLYHKLVTGSPDMHKQFVFVPLQYQPERTSSPDGGAYVDQFLMINLLRKQLPPHVAIFVKEHSAQFHPRMDGHLGRFEFNYRDIAALPNVYLISETYSSFDLIDKCVCLATLTGTAGLEAVARRKPVLVFGPGCWYRSLPGVFYTYDSLSLQAAWSEIERGYHFNDDDVFNFLKKIFRVSFSAKLTPQYPVKISSEENIQNLVTAVQRYALEVMNRIPGGN